MKLKVSLVAGKTCFVSLPPFLADDLLNRHGDALKAGAIEVTWASQNRSAETAIGRATQSGPVSLCVTVFFSDASHASRCQRLLGLQLGPLQLQPQLRAVLCIARV